MCHFNPKAPLSLPDPISEGGETKIAISKVVVGGSVAHGTAVPGHFDIDLVAFSPSKYTNDHMSCTMISCMIQILAGILPTNMKITEKQYKDILDQMKECLEESLSQHYKPDNFEILFHGWRFDSWHFTVDLQLSPQWEQPDLEDMYSHLQKIPPRNKGFRTL